MYRTIVTLFLLFVGIVVGAGLTIVIVGLPGRSGSPQAGQAEGVKYTCSMHPQIVMDHPGICPLCGMDLTPIKPSSEGDDSPVQLTLSEHARSMADVGAVVIRPRELFKEIRTVGKVDLDETRVAYIPARVGGRVDQVYADFPGTPVKQGEHLVSIYSPELLSTQEEFLTAYRREEAQRRSGRPDLGLDLSAASRRRLQLWGITDKQLDELAQSGRAQTHLVVYAPVGGTVIDKKIRAGQYVKEGDLLYTIADLKQVWLILEVYESELSWVRFGQPVQVTLESEPDRSTTGSVAFIEPVLNEATRTVRVRVILNNLQGRFKPGMYAQALVRVPIMPDGGPAPTGLEGKYACPMHPYEVSEKPGDCRVCGMPLERVPGKPATDPRGPRPTVLAVPAEAVLTTGRRQVVYLEEEPGKYRLVEPKLGPRAGDYFPVLSGLKEGDRVVTRGNFLLDSQFQITGRSSLLYPEGTAGVMVGHAGHGAGGGGTSSADFSAKELGNLEKLPAEDRSLAMAQKVCPITGAKLGSMGKPYKMTVDGRTLFLCCPACESKVKQDPQAALRKIAAGGANLGSPSKAPASHSDHQKHPE